jgi:mRNA-degrading endonuclease RelE of RelBE toxin-antitoxin system
MTYEVQLTETFQKSIKALKKKYPKVKNDLLDYIKALEEDPSAGDPIPGWSKEIWKVRVASSDVRKGKRGRLLDSGSPLLNSSQFNPLIPSIPQPLNP